MSVTVRLPRMLSDAVHTETEHLVSGATVAAVLDDLFTRVPGLHNHILDEEGEVRPHVSVFVDGLQADMSTGVGAGSEIRVLHAVSGGSPHC